MHSHSHGCGDQTCLSCQTLYLPLTVGRVWSQSSTDLVACTRNVISSTLCTLLMECGLLNELSCNDYMKCANLFSFQANLKLKATVVLVCSKMR